MSEDLRPSGDITTRLIINNKKIKSPFHKLIENSKFKMTILSDKLALKNRINY